MYTVLVAPTAYKGSLSPLQVALLIKRGFEASGVASRVICRPLADGGDGTVEALQLAAGGDIMQLEVAGPLGQPVIASWLRLGNQGVIELACASGLALLNGRDLRPLAAHTFGTGQILEHCLSLGLEQIVLAVGGSASTDGGTGALQALGARFLDNRGEPLPLGGGPLIELAACDLSPAAKSCSPAQIKIATDVLNPLLGVRGAAAVFAPQKGATLQETRLLEEGLTRLADVMEQAAGRYCRDLAGSGAAGGTAFGLATACGATIIPGFEWIAGMLGLDSAIEAADVVVSAEGKLDSQSIEGKVIGGLIKRCAAAHKPLWVLPAQVEPGFDGESAGIDRVLAVGKSGRPATSYDLEHAACELAQLALPRV